MVAALALAVIVGADALVGRVFQSPWPRPSEVHLSYDDAVRNAGLMSLGMRRLAADIEFIRLLEYFGTPSERGEGTEAGVHHEDESPSDSYPEFEGRVLRILDIDPYFRYAAEYGAGALAFDLHRPDEAIAVLRHALARDPKNWRYQAYLAAIAFQKQGRAEQVHDQLAAVADDPEAPTMLKHLLAFLDLRLGRREEAIRLYREILSSRDKGYAEFARGALKRLGAAQDPARGAEEP